MKFVELNVDYIPIALDLGWTRSLGPRTSLVHDISLFVRLMAKNFKRRLGRPRKTCRSRFELDPELVNILCSIVALIIQLH